MELFRGDDTQQTESRINTILPSTWNNHSQVSYKGYRAVRERISCKGGGAYRIADYISQQESEVDVMKNLCIDNKSGYYYFRKEINGDKIRFSLGTKKVGEAKAKRDAILREYNYTGRLPERISENETPDVMTFSEMVDVWLVHKEKQVKAGEITPKTLKEYRKHLDKYILPKFGDQSLQEIKKVQIENFLDDLVGLAKKSKKHILTPLAGILKKAVKMELIEFNPAREVEIESGKEPKKSDPLTPDEIWTFIETVDDHYKPVFQFAFNTGMRWSEITALKWKNVDFRKRIVKVRESRVEGYEGKTKNAYSNRNVKLNDTSVEALKKQKEVSLGKSEYVFLNKHSGPITTGTLCKSTFKPTLIKAGLNTNRSIKDTRGSYTTNNINASEKLSSIQKQIGHAIGSSVTLKQYYGDTPDPEFGNRFDRISKPVSKPVSMSGS